MTSPKGEGNYGQDIQHLFRAILKGKAHLTRFMLAASNNSLLNCLNDEGRTPLIECCYIKEEATRGHMVWILKDAGVDVNMKDRTGKTALIHACEQKCNDVVRTLIQHANICPDVEDIDGNTALIHSAYAGNDIALELLVKSFRRLGLNVDHYNKAGYTALHVATTNGFLHCAKILAVKGRASLTLKDKVHQMTPLEWCLNEGYQKSEVEFLKPSAKFYRVAKLTTTMAKYRKKSTQENLPSSETSHWTSPAEVNEKPKSKVKGLLRKVKAQPGDDDFDGMDSVYVTNYNKLVDNMTNEINYRLKSMDSEVTESSGQRTSLNKQRERSFSQSEQNEQCQDKAIGSTGLHHTRSYPMTSKEFEMSDVASLLETDIANERFGYQECLTLPDEYGDCDTDDIGTLCSDLNSSLSISNVDQNQALLSNFEIDFGNQEERGQSKSSNEVLFYCGSKDIHPISSSQNEFAYSQYDLCEHPSILSNTPMNISKHKPSMNNVPPTVASVSSISEFNLTPGDTQEGSMVDEKHRQISTEKQQLVAHSNQYSVNQKAAITRTIDDERAETIAINPTEKASNKSHNYMSQGTEHVHSIEYRQQLQEKIIDKKLTTEKDTSHQDQRQVSMRPVPTTMCTPLFTMERDKNRTTELTSIDRNATSPETAILYTELDKFSQSPLVSPKSSNSLTISKSNENRQTLKFSGADLPSSDPGVTKAVTYCETEAKCLENGNKKLQGIRSSKEKTNKPQTITRTRSEWDHASGSVNRQDNGSGSHQPELEYLDLGRHCSQTNTHGIQIDKAVTMTLTVTRKM